MQLRAKAKRASAILPGAFRESGFKFLNTSIEIWNRSRFMSNPKWREDAIRRADKRKARQTTRTKPIRNSVKRFRVVMENLYKQSLEKKESKVEAALEDAKKAIGAIGKEE